MLCKPFIIRPIERMSAEGRAHDVIDRIIPNARLTLKKRIMRGECPSRLSRQAGEKVASFPTDSFDRSIGFLKNKPDRVD